MRTEGPLDSDFNTRPCLDFAERLPAANDDVNRIPRGFADALCRHEQRMDRFTFAGGLVAWCDSDESSANAFRPVQFLR